MEIGMARPSLPFINLGLVSPLKTVQAWSHPTAQTVLPAVQLTKNERIRM